MTGEVIGAYINDTNGSFSYQAGLFSGSIKDEFTDFKGGYGILLGMQYDLSLFYETGSLHLDYLFGLTLLPTFDLAHNLLMGNDKLQLSLRYHYATSSDDHSLQFS